jgi:hypothetical protein
MLRVGVLLVVALITPMRVEVLAHPGHGDPVLISGTITAIEPSRIQLESLDRASVSLKRVWVITNDKTVVRAGKARLPVSVLKVGQPVEFAGETDLGPADEPLIRALTFRVKAPKN